MSRYGGGGGRRDLDCKLYVGDLPRDASEKDLERAFSYYGPLKNVWVARNPSGFAFVEFEDTRDAEDAVRGLDGSTAIGNQRIRVEHSTGKSRPKPWMTDRRSGGGGGRGGGGDRGGGDRGGDRGDRFGGDSGPPRFRKPFDPTDRCYECGGRGHYAYDCSRYKRGRKSPRRRSDSRSRSRSVERGHRSYSRSRSPSPRRRYRSRTRSRSPAAHGRSRSREASRDRSRDRSPAHNSPDRNGDAN